MKKCLGLVTVLLLVMTTGLVVTENAWAEGKTRRTSVARLTDLASEGRLDAEVNRAAAHVDGAQGRQRFDRQAAAAAGVERPVLDLTEQLVAGNNHMVSSVRAGVKLHDISLAAYPLVMALLADEEIAKAQRARPTSDKISLRALQACGSKSNPVPASNPRRYIAVNTRTKAAAEKYFRDTGYHRTAPYACGAVYRCSHDWTRGRSYRSRYGFCSSPRFRDHGVRDRYNRATAQYGEPNPEIHAYVWPYLTWPAYVKWWHDRF